MAGRKPSRRAHGTHRDYPRTARLNELLREILAEELERIEDDRLELLTIISVDVDADLRKAIVYYDCLDGADGDEDAQAGLGEATKQLKGAIARQAHVKRVPELAFAPDPSVREGARIEAILATIPPPVDHGDDEVSDDEVIGDEAGTVVDDDAAVDDV